MCGKSLAAKSSKDQPIVQGQKFNLKWYLLDSVIGFASGMESLEFGLGFFYVEVEWNFANNVWK